MLPVATPRTAAIVAVQHLGGGKAGEDLHAHCLGLFAQPLGDGAQADDVVAVVVQAVGDQPLRCLLRAGGFGQEVDLVSR
jgi:hypothetical protein